MVAMDRAQSERKAALDARLAERGLTRIRVEEPDLDGRLTALCVEPGARRELAGLELAG
jgi:hypothetical protein